MQVIDLKYVNGHHNLMVMAQGKRAEEGHNFARDLTLTSYSFFSLLCSDGGCWFYHFVKSGHHSQLRGDRPFDSLGICFYTQKGFPHLETLKISSSPLQNFSIGVSFFQYLEINDC